MNFSTGFIRNEKLLLETSKMPDLLRLNGNIQEFSNKLNTLKGGSMVGFVGEFGSGKSTFIDNVKNQRITEGTKEKRIDFDAWKYPERKNLREGFVLDFAQQVDEKTFQKARKEMDGQQQQDMQTLMKTLGNAAGMFLPGGNIISNLSHFFKTSPARRVFEIQEILCKLLNKVEEDKIFIIIEDLDRSGDAGIFFLETLKQFINENELPKEIIIIVPIGKNEYENDIDSYLKPIDYFEFFTTNNLSFDNFIQEIFIEDIVQSEGIYGPLKEFLEGVFDHYPSNINLRKLKLILRKANQNHKIMYDKYKDKFTLDWRLNLIFETAKYIKNSDDVSIYKQCRDHGIELNTLFGAYIYNLVSFTNRNNNHYWGDNTTLLTNNSGEKNMGDFNITNIPIKFKPSTTDKEILGGWFESNGSIVHFVVPQQYLEY